MNELVNYSVDGKMAKSAEVWRHLALNADISGSCIASATGKYASICMIISDLCRCLNLPKLIKINTLIPVFIIAVFSFCV